MIKKITIVLVTAFVIGLPISSNANQQFFDCMEDKNNVEKCNHHLQKNTQSAAPPPMPGMTPPAAPPSMPGMAPSAGS